jgi:5-formyltetrahydrofolate cyclo-ligase
MSGVADLKKAARAAAFARRKPAFADSARAVPLATTRLLEYVSGLQNVGIVSGYLPIRTEIDPVPAMKELHEQGKKLCVPVVMDAGEPLEFHAWTPDCALKSGPFGASVPIEGEIVQPDLLIVPLAAFDRKCYRLGYGGGFYDRTLEKLRAERRVMAVGFAFSEQFCENVPVGPFDQTLDGIVTDLSIYSPH